MNAVDARAVVRSAITAAALVTFACGDDAPERATAPADAPDAADDSDGAIGDAGDAAASGYGDGVCTEQEFLEGNEAIEISTSLAAGGPGLVSAWVDRNQMKLDGIWEDCFPRLCPVVAQVYAECAANFVNPDHDEDAGPPPGNPCGVAPPECDPYLD